MTVRSITMKDVIERRKHKRFRVREGAFAALKSHWFRSTILGEIIDISNDGLAFRYIAAKKRSGLSFKLKMLLADGSFSLERVPSRTISDIEIGNEFSVDFTPIRRCCVQFTRLTRDQISGLDHFIRNYSIDEV